MRRLIPLIVTSCSLLLLPACDSGGSGDGDGGSAESGETGDASESADESGTTGDPDTGSSGGESSSGSGTGEMAWHGAAGPCGGSGTNTLWFDDRNNGFIGCGENADGEGLYTSVDGGESWEDNMRFGEVRVMDIRRGPDGVLYGAGIHQLDGYSVFSIDESGSRLEPEGLYDPGNNAFTKVAQAENIAVTDDGQMLIDSLTGVTAAYKAAADDFVELGSLSEEAIADPDATGFQVRRIVAFENAFYSVGSLINDPARVHLPSRLDGATFHFQSVELQASTRDGELLDMHMWAADNMIVAGHDQSERFPLIYLLDGGDAYDADAWEQIELWDSGLEYQGGVNDLHVVGDTVVAAGEKIPTSEGGFLVLSEDGGRTWEDITPNDGDVGVFSAVWMFDDGELVVAGGGGEMWVYAAE